MWSRFDDGIYKAHQDISQDSTRLKPFIQSLIEGGIDKRKGSMMMLDAHLII